MKKTQDHSRSVPWVRTLAPMLRSYKPHLVAAGLTLGVDAWLTALRPWPLKVVIDRVISGGPCRVPLVGTWVNDLSRHRATVLMAACVASIVIALGTGLCTYVYTLLMGHVSQGVLIQLRSRLFAHLQHMSLRFHDNVRLGDLMVRLTSDIGSIRMLIARSLMQFASNALLMVSMLTLMIWLDWRFTLVAGSVAPLLFWAVWWHTRKIKTESRSARESDGKQAAVAHESLAMIRMVKGLGQESVQRSKFDEQGIHSLSHYTMRLRHQARMAPIVDLLAATGFVLVMWFGATSVMADRLSIGDVIVFFAYVTNFYSPMRAMSRQASVFSKTVVGAERVAEVLLNEPDDQDSPSARPAPRLIGAITFDKVHFSYTDHQSVLQDFNLKIHPGERVAIVGPTGVGKTTLISLLLKFYQPQEGRILFDGTDLRDWTATSIRQQIGLALQDCMLFHGSILENVLYGYPEGGLQDAMEACQAARADEFINRLPQGLHTVVAENGKSLSGGQRQRLAIARAIVRKPPILLLDEPTSHLDGESEAAVIESLNRAAAGRTTILVTHRPEPLNLVQRVIVFEAGRIVADCHPEEVYSRHATRLFGA